MRTLTSILFVTVTAFGLIDCSPAKITVSDDFRSKATALPVKGLNGFTINQTLTVGDYKTSRIKRGWDFSSSMQHTKMLMTPEEAILKVYNIDTDKKRMRQENKFQFNIVNGNQSVSVYAMENFRTEELVYKSNNPYIGDASQTKRFDYSFSAAILSSASEQPWSLVMMNRYDQKKDTARGLFDRPYVEQEGYATDGKETIGIAPLSLERTNSKGETKQVSGGRILSGYELKINNTPVAMIDILDNKLWLLNELNEEKKLLISSIASAILLKRVQDPQEL